jgi:hypothetical protein
MICHYDCNEDKAISQKKFLDAKKVAGLGLAELADARERVARFK